MTIPKLKGKILYGGDYNPEQWPEETWREDMRLMKRAGINLVSIAVFSWGKLQPREDVYEFDWLDRLMDLLADNNIYACLATSTASPPMWMAKRYPDILAVDRNGQAFHSGSRQYFSPNSATFRRFASALIERMAERYHNHPALAAWHVNNEYANHVTECHSIESTNAFRNWLILKYRDLDTLNEAWTTAFWSQTYHDWSEIETPRRTASYNNPSQELDFRRFSNDSFLDLFRMEKASLQKYSPWIPVATNFMMWFKPLDYWAWAKELSFVAWDSYPDPAVGMFGFQGLHYAAACHDLMRSLKGGQPFILIEQSTSNVSWRPINAIKPPGQMRLWSMQALARGSDGVMFFQWRASRGGAEKYCSSIVGHVGADRSRIYNEVLALGAELEKLSVVTESVQTSRAAILFDWASWWALELDAKPAPIKYCQSAVEAHAYFYQRNIPIDFAQSTGDLSKYNVVVAPALYLLSSEGAANLRSFVRQGGTLVLTYFSGIVDENDRVQCGGYPALLRDVLGLWVEEWAPLQVGQNVKLRFLNSDVVQEGTEWCDLLHLEGATGLAHYTQDFWAGRPAVTKHRFGLGYAYYLGTKLNPASFSNILDEVCAETGTRPVFEVPDGVEATMRTKGATRFLFLINHGESDASISMREVSGVNLVTGEEVVGVFLLEAGNAVVIQVRDP